jgi:hypothetical protein
MNISSKKRSAFLLLAALMLLLFNAPLLSICNKIAFCYGIPSLYIYLFTTWFCCILLLIVNATFRNYDNNKKP